MKNFLAIIITALALAVAPAARATEYLFKNISLRDGLSQSSVQCMARDHRGFLWLGTKFGLNRYDSNNIRTYYASDGSNALPDNAITVLFTDSRGTLWVGTEQGLCRYNERTDDFTRIYGPAGNSLLRVSSIREENGGLILGAHGALFYYDFESEKAVRLLTKGGTANNNYNRIIPWREGFYILSTRWGGVWLYERAGANISPIETVAKNVLRAAVDSRGRLWISKIGVGLECYDENFNLIQTITPANSGLTNAYVRDILELDGELWLATDGGGICIYNPERNEVRPLHNPSADHQLASVLSLYCDQTGNIFAGTVRSGAILLQKVAMATFQGTTVQGVTLGAFTALLPDNESSRIWCALDGGGMVCHDPATSTFGLIAPTKGMKVTGLAHLPGQRLLLSTYDTGFFIYDKHSGALSPAGGVLHDFFFHTLTCGIACHLANLSPGTVAIVSDHIALYDTERRTLSPQHIAGNKFIGHMTIVYARAGHLVMAGQDFLADFDQYTRRARVAHFNNGEQLIHAAYDGNRYLYAATDRSIHRIDLTDGSATLIPAPRPQQINAMAIEGARLWIGSPGAVSAVSLADSGSLVFDQFDGAEPNEFLPGVNALTPEHLYMGGTNGLLRINRSDVDSIVHGSASARLSLAEFTIDGISSVAAIDADGTVDVPASYSRLGISVIDGDINAMRRKLFRFFLNGPDDPRPIETYAHTIYLSTLTPGSDYPVYVSCSNPDGTWSAAVPLVHLNMLAPWWRTKWAIAVLMILLAAVVVFAYLVHRRRQRLIFERRLADYRNTSLKQQLRFLAGTSVALRTPLTMIYAPVKALIESLRRGEQVDLLPQLDSIYSNSKKIRDVIDMSMDLHNTPQTTDPDRLSVFDFGQLCRHCLEKLQPEIAGKDLKLKPVFPARTADVLADRSRMERAVQILMRACVQHSEPGGPIDVAVTINDDNHSVVLQINCYGEQVDEAACQHLFSQYCVETPLGSGLELAFARVITEGFSGNVEASPLPDETPGVAMSLTLPLDAAEAPQPRRASRASGATVDHPVAAASSLVDSVDTSDMTVVIAEEDSELAQFLAGQLRPHFKKVFYATNGRDALLMVRQNLPDLVISSLMLPLKSGYEVCHAIKSSPELSHIPVILLTALKEDPSIESGYNAGADSYITKPFDIGVLLSRCRNLLYSRSVMRLRYTGTGAENAAAAPLSNADETFLIKIDKIIAENISSPDIGVELVVEKMNMSRSALYTRFRDLTGKSVGSHINDCRLRRAKELLRNRSLSISDISEQLGFSSQRYFSTFFKDKTGMSPSAFRATD